MAENKDDRRDYGALVGQVMALQSTVGTMQGKLGELTSSERERRAQTSRLFDLVNDLSARVPDLRGFVSTVEYHMARDESEHADLRAGNEQANNLLMGTDDGEDGVMSRLRSLEDDRTTVKRGAKLVATAAVGVPSFIVAVFELWHKVIGK